MAGGAGTNIRGHEGSRMAAGFLARRAPSDSTRRMFVLGFGCTALLGVMLICLSIGPTYVTIGTVWEALWEDDGTAASELVRETRVPRVLLAAMVGASLAMSGAILQGVTRNPFGDPHLLGVSAGAALVAVSIAVFAPGMPDGAVAPLAFAGGFFGGLLTYAMAWRGGASPMRLVLAGVAVTFILFSVMAGVLVTSSLSAEDDLRWLVGGLEQGNWDDFALMWPYFVAGMLITLVMMRSINPIAVGDELATSLGQHVERTRFILGATAALLASAAVSIVGLIGFLGLAVPHLVRSVIGDNYRFVLPASAIFGAMLLVVADTVSRTVVTSPELPAGILTAAICAPVLILLVRARA